MITKIFYRLIQVIALFFPSLSANADTYVTGSLLNDTLWSSGTYILDGTVSVATGVTLTISPGVTVLTKNFSSTLLVGGNLIAEGTESQRITFSSLNPASAGPYATNHAIKMSNSSGSRISYATISNASIGLSLDGNSSLIASNNLFQNNRIAVTDSGGYQSMNFQHNTFSNNYSAFSGIRTTGNSYFNFNNFQDNNNEGNTLDIQDDQYNNKLVKYFDELSKLIYSTTLL
jgi:hypothetical protein